MKMKTEPFKLLIVFVIIISILAAGIAVLILVSNLNNMPSAESGLIVSKSVISSNESVIELQGGTTLHILNNASLYSSLQKNQTYSFACFYNYYTKTTYVESATITK